MDEAGIAVGITDELEGQELQGDDAVELQVLATVDDPHVALAELLEDAIVRNCLSYSCGFFAVTDLEIYQVGAVSHPGKRS